VLILKHKRELTRVNWPEVKTQEHTFFHFGQVFNIQFTRFFYHFYTFFRPYL